MSHLCRYRVGAVLLLGLAGAHGAGEVTRVRIEQRVEIAGDFGETGAYEKIAGRVFFEFDPASPFNARIVDLTLAPRNARGMVEGAADFMVLQAVVPERRRGTALVEVSNRGGKASLGYLNRAAYAADPSDPVHFGDGLLMRLGVTVIWVGWQWDVPREPGRLRLDVPVARSGVEGAGPITGLVRSDWTVDRPARLLALAHRNHVAYPVSDQDDPANVLTVRDGRDEPRRVIPRERWRFARASDDGEVADPTHATLDGGFEAGRIYELVYRAKEPRVVGLGLAAIRDMTSYALHDPACEFGARHAIGLGISQTGRMLRQYVYQGFNTDERGRKVFDGLMIHTAGAGRGSFNHRFAQPSRDGHRYSAFFYPTDLFPFSFGTQTDARAGRTDGLAAHAHDPGHTPKVFSTNTGYEYWGRGASLLHTSPDGLADVEPLATERIYHVSSAQHFTDRFPPREGSRVEGTGAFVGNPLDLLVTVRALFVAMLGWVEDGREPPPSAYPRLADGTLVPVDRLGWPGVPSVASPSVVHVAYRADYGPRWGRGVIDRQPPRLGDAFPSLVGRVDEIGNEAAGLRGLEVLTPLATYTPWSTRAGLPGPEGELRDFRGLFIPLARTEAERVASGDGRPSLEGLYGSRGAFMEASAASAESLRADRLLLAEDVGRVLERAGRVWDWIWRDGG